MSTIRIVTDSTSDLPRWFVDQHRIKVVPLYINFTDASYLDGVDLTMEEFYPMLAAAGKELPKTSTPTTEDFLKVYREILEEEPECEILSIHLSGGLSGTVGVAESAGKSLSPKIHVFDSRNISFGTGLQIFEAIEKIEEKLGLSEILAHLKKVADHTETMFCLDTLEYLHKGGRIGGAAAFVGSMLNIKPIIHVKNGVYEPFDKVRSQKQAIAKMVQQGVKVLDGKLPKRLGVMHGAAEEMAQSLKELAESTFRKAVDNMGETGPVIGTHTGPGTLGMTICYL